MSTDEIDERELQPLNSSGERQQQDNWQQLQSSEAGVDSAVDEDSATQAKEATRPTVAQQAPQNVGQTESIYSEVLRSASTAWKSQCALHLLPHCFDPHS